jgi:hypothetical protein
MGPASCLNLRLDSVLVLFEDLCKIMRVKPGVFQLFRTAVHIRPSR